MMGKKIFYYLPGYIRKVWLSVLCFFKLQGSFADKKNYQKRYINPYIDMLEEQYRVRGVKGNKIKEFHSCVNEICTNRDELYLSKIVIVMGTRCSLRCKDCNNLMPYFKNPGELDTQKILKSITKICQISKSILHCELIGGEPFLQSNLGEILNYVISIETIKNVDITTNGTIIPKNNMIIKLLQNPKVYVRISDYGERVDNGKFIDFLITNNIKYEVLEMGWVAPGNMVKRNRNRILLKKQYSRCSGATVCKTLFEDKLFVCSRAASLYALGILPDEYISINEKLNAKKLKQFLLNDFSIACDYCDVASDDQKRVEAAVQL